MTEKEFRALPGAEEPKPTRQCRICGGDVFGTFVVCRNDLCIDAHVFQQCARAEREAKQ